MEVPSGKNDPNTPSFFSGVLHRYDMMNASFVYCCCVASESTL